MNYYVEYVFAENFFIDFILLYITGTLIKKKIIYKRLAVGALIGALYVVAVFYFKRVFLTFFIVKLSISVLMVTVAFDNASAAAGIRAILCFYIVTLLMVGVISSLYYLTDNKLTVNIILISIFMGFVILKLLFYEIKQRKEKNNYIRTVNICINKKKRALRAFIDTGNELTDPLTGKPVIVAGMDCLKDMLDKDIIEEIQEFYKNKDKNYISLFLEKNLGLNFRTVRYNTISNKGDVMLCVVPDSITILCDDKNIIEADALIGIYPKRISQTGDYDALLFKKLLDWEGEIVNEAKL